MSWSVHDAVELEKRGVPAIFVVTTAFVAQAGIVAKQQGLAGIRMIVVPHPLGGLPAAEVDRIAGSAGAATLELIRREYASRDKANGRDL